jgi:YD repeat-containing protein
MAVQERLEATVPAVTILQTADQVIGEVNKAGRVTAVSYTPEAALSGAASPASRTLTLVNKTQAGIGSTTIATLALVSGVDLVAFDEKAITLTATVADRAVAAGDEIVWVSTAVGGTGLTDPGGHVVVEIGASSYADTGTGDQVAQTQS